MTATVSGQALWTSWSAAPLVVVPLLVLAHAYARGTQRLWRRPGGRRAVRPWQAGALAGGLLVLVAALLSPLDALAGTLLSAHMVQHLLLLLVAPPLLVLAAPLLPVTWALPEGLRHRLRRWGPQARVRRHRRSATLAAAALAANLAIVLGWHLPALYESAVHVPAVHLLEHATMLGSAWLLWWLLLRGGEAGRAAYGLAVVAVFVSAVVGGAFGALMAFAPTPWYAVYAQRAPAWGLDALTDQQLAGLLMWVGGGTLLVVAGAALFASWLRALERRADRRPGSARLGPITAATPVAGRER